MQIGRLVLKLHLHGKPLVLLELYLFGGVGASRVFFLPNTPSVKGFRGEVKEEGLDVEMLSCLA